MFEGSPQLAVCHFRLGKLLLCTSVSGTADLAVQRTCCCQVLFLQYLKTVKFILGGLSPASWEVAWNS